jgi:D-serine deaminase-like pyridoxal phosphate-dependent protein
MMRIDDLDTPCVLVDLDRVERNLARWQTYCDEHGLANRPHIKTHKLVELARRQVELGAVGIACQKLGEAEVMAEGGLADILIPYNLIGAAKLARAVSLADRVTLRVSCDAAAVAQGLSGAFAGSGRTLGVLVECDTGAHRCGVAAPEAATTLAQTIDRLPGLRFEGLMTYPAPGGQPAVRAFVAEALERLGRHGLAAAIVSSGGTPDMWRAHTVEGVTEHRAGTYVYNDRMQVRAGSARLEDCALRVLTTVVSRPTAERAILDAGSKSLTSDLYGLEGYGLIEQYPAARLDKLSEEHGHVELGAAAGRPALGERVTVIPNHCCVVSNLFDEVMAVRGEEVAARLRVRARGRVQ